MAAGEVTHVVIELIPVEKLGKMKVLLLLSYVESFYFLSRCTEMNETI